VLTLSSLCRSTAQPRLRGHTTITSPSSIESGVTQSTAAVARGQRRRWPGRTPGVWWAMEGAQEEEVRHLGAKASLKALNIRYKVRAATTDARSFLEASSRGTVTDLCDVQVSCASCRLNGIGTSGTAMLGK